ADAARHPVGVHPVEQELRGPAADAQEVAEASERDPAGSLALGDERRARLLVRRRRDRVAVADPDEPPLLLEEARERAVLHLDRLQAEPRLERRRRLGARAEPGGGAGPVELGAPALE